MKLAPTPLAFQGRIFFLRGLVILCFLLVLGGYYRVQVLQRERYEALGEKYRIKKRRIKATRGFIYDREQNLIAQNMPTYNLVLRRDEMEQPWRTLRPRIQAFLGSEKGALEERYRKRSHLLSQPVLLKENIGFYEALRVKRNGLRYPGLAIDTTERRFYVHGQWFTHVLGYVGETTSKQIKKNPRLRMGDIIGKSGLELAYDSFLTGTDGERTILVDHQGITRDEWVNKPPDPGADLFLTLDLELQKMAVESLKGQGGSIVMMDVRSGEILVYFSSPTFNLNLFTEGFTTESWQELLNSPGKPFINRPIQGTYAPGSVFKLVTALSALTHRKVTLETKYFCTGEFAFPNRVFHCHARGGHGWVNLTRAIQSSCNVYFYNIAQVLDVNDLAETAFEMGFGNPTGIDLVGEKAGLMPTREWKRRLYDKPWYTGETLSLAIGQGSLQVTPIQLLSLMSMIATEGQVVTPHLLLKARRGEEVSYYESEPKTISSIPASYFSVLKTAMWQVVNQNNGTGARAKVEGFDVCGKTGTAQLITFSTEAEHKVDANKNAWFAGFAPRDKPQVAIIVLVEHANSGGGIAAPIARALLEAYRNSRTKVKPT